MAAGRDDGGAAGAAGAAAGAAVTIGDLRAGVAGATGAARGAAEAIAASIAEAARLREEIAVLDGEAAVAQLLAGHLTARGFERWIVKEALDLLVVGASDTLRRLSGGQYSLVCDERNEFLVVDHRNADERRPAKTLSGGETFQASLALALGLADQLAGLAAGGAAKLESIFLDEGFGTLDPEALAVVADTIEALGSDERLVGIVTHVPRARRARPGALRGVEERPHGDDRAAQRVSARLTIDPWDPAYGVSVEVDELEPSAGDVDVDIEVPAADWAPVPAPPPGRFPDPVVLFVDGVRRVEAHVWIEGPDGSVDGGICASFAAGAIRCDGTAHLVDVQVGRALVAASAHVADLQTSAGTFAATASAGPLPAQLSLALQQAMGAAEAGVAGRACAASGCQLVVIDGPLRGRAGEHHAVGFVKTHHVAYLPPEQHRLVARLGPGERTPLFTLGASWNRYSWYLRLPGPGGSPWAGVVRCESAPDMAPAAARSLADLACAALPRYASDAYKDARAPQNLYPIGALERELRRRLGDPMVVYRALRRAAHDAPVSAAPAGIPSR